VTRPLPPLLEYRCPDCSICGKETSYEDESFTCEDCNCSWPERNAYDFPGEWNDPEAQQCGETIRPYLTNTWIKADDIRKHLAFRCERDADHVDSASPDTKPHAHNAMTVHVKGWL